MADHDELSSALSYERALLGRGGKGKSKEGTAAAKAGGPPIRVLMLHGYTQNAEGFEAMGKAFRRKLGPRFEYVYATAPHTVPRTSTVDIEGFPVEIENHNRENARCWFYYFAEDAAKLPEDFHDPARTRPYFGLVESLEYLEKLSSEQGPFDAVVGFSQGATMVHTLAALAAGTGGAALTRTAPWLGSVKACVLISGFPSRSDVEALSSAAGLPMPSMHIAGEADDVSSVWDSVCVLCCVVCCVCVGGVLYCVGCMGSVWVVWVVCMLFGLVRGVLCYVGTVLQRVCCMIYDA